MLSFEVPFGKNQYDGRKFAAHVRTKIAPFLRKSFPGKTQFRLLLDGESVQHTPEAKAAMTEFGFTALAKWAPSSPELNPQEHVWAGAEPELRKSEDGHESFEDWKKLLVPAVKAYPACKKLIPSMAKRVQMCLDNEGQMIRK